MTAFLDWFLGLFKAKPGHVQELAVPVVSGSISAVEVVQILRNQLNLTTDELKALVLSDLAFDLCSKTEAERFTKQTQIASGQYTANAHDCDNFSFGLMGYWSDSLKSFAFGVMWSQNHAFNWLIDDAKQLWIVEPQTNVFLTPEQAALDSRYGARPFRWICC